MRRLNELEDSVHDDRGASTIFIVIAMTAILIGAAFAIDVGQYVVEARSAQNTADATVMALATDCALTGSPIADYSPYRKPGQTINAPACDLSLNEAAVTATKDVGGLLLQQSVGAVDRSATAKWGTLGIANTVPIVIAKCEFDKFPVDSTSDIIITLPKPPNTSECDGGPGGFGQLDSAVGSCEVEITAGGTAPGKPGTDLHKQIHCLTPLPSDLLIPVFDETACPVNGCQGNGQYPILGFAVFHLTGFRFQSGGPGSSQGTLASTQCDNTIGFNCIRGDFIKFTTQQGSPGPSTDFGVTQVYLSS